MDCPTTFDAIFAWVDRDSSFTSALTLRYSHTLPERGTRVATSAKEVKVATLAMEEPSVPEVQSRRTASCPEKAYLQVVKIKSLATAHEFVTPALINDLTEANDANGSAP